MKLGNKTKKTVYAVVIIAAAILIGAGQGIFSSELRTEITINAPAEKVWANLVDFESFPKWNPFIRKAKGDLQPGGKLEVYLQAEGADGMTFTPTVLKVEKNREFRWLGKLGVSGIFDGEHIFTVQPNADGSVLFIHREEFNGVLVPLVLAMIEDDTRRGFNDMNRALKKRSE